MANTGTVAPRARLPARFISACTAGNGDVAAVVPTLTTSNRDEAARGEHGPRASGGGDERAFTQMIGA